jgi:hypothetical protein
MFPMGEAVSEEYKKELRSKMMDYKKQKDEEVKKHREELEKREKSMQELLMKTEQEHARKLTEEKNRFRQTMEEELRKSISTDFENKIQLLQESNIQSDEKLKEARKKELEYLKKQQELEAKEQELQIAMQKQLIEARTSLAEQIRREEIDKINLRETELQLKLKEMEKQLDVQKKLAEEMRRKAEQGSMQLQGEAQELLLEEILRDNFPVDHIVEVRKGVEGADCIMVIRSKTGIEYGKIIFESKRAKGWSNSWVEKLRNDMRSKQADLAVLVTQVFPKNMECFGERDGVWVCSFKEVTGLTAALRNAIVRIAETKKTEENKGEKMQTLYNFLTGIEFRQQMEAIVEGFVSLKDSIIREKIQMEKMWREREKQLEKVLINTAGMYGSIKGIAGASVSSIPLLDNNAPEPELF